ncbi:MAG: HNH endonuclease [Nitrososphaera sp.]|nr:HNH endonuclease [Nitrososphaera sp.]
MNQFLSGFDSGLQLLWGGGEVEVFPENEFTQECKARPRKLLLRTRRGRIMCDEEYSLTVKGAIAILDYGGKFKQANIKPERDLYIGKTKIEFTDEERLYVKSVKWQDEGKDEYDYNIEYSDSWKPLDKRKLPKFRIPKSEAKQKVKQATTPRPGQERFRRDLIAATDGRCCLSGCKILESLEAAHIHPYQNEQSDHPQNGLLLRADLHRLFDAFLFAIEPSTLRVHLSPFIIEDSDYGMFQGKKLILSRHKEHWPSKVSLEWRWKKFKGRYKNGVKFE